MIQISLVSSVHEEKGLANGTELFRVLESLRPEVIFLEVPTSLNEDQISNGLRETLESKSVERYCQYNPVELIPVDLPTPEFGFFKNNEYLYKRIEKASREYCRLIDWDSEYVSAYGFAYLNSSHCDKTWNDIEREVEETVRQLNEQRLMELLELWKQTIERRDVEMLNNIRRYCTETTYERGVFLVRASHRRSIKKKVENLNKTDSSIMVWNFLESETGK